jgi:hypothetical protein
MTLELNELKSNAAKDSIFQYAERFVELNGDGDIRTTFDGDYMEILVVQCKDGYLPSVRTDSWDAPASTIDPNLAVASRKEALAWGLCDALTAHLGEEDEDA